MKIHNLSDHIIDDSGFGIPDISLPINSNEKAQLLPQLQLIPDNGYPRLIENYKKLESSRIKHSMVNGMPVTITLNTTRTPSVNAVISKTNDECILCYLHPGQRGFKIPDGRYLIVMNPGVTQKGDMTIINLEHVPQEISPNFPDMLEVAKKLPDFTVYFNGMFAGASCPHLHFQAGKKDLLAGEKYLVNNLHDKLISQPLIQHAGHELSYIRNYLCPVYVIRGSDKNIIHTLFAELKSKLEPEYHKIGNSFIPPFGQNLPGFNIAEREPRMNLFARFLPETEEYFIGIFPRVSNRPKTFYEDDETRVLVGLAIKECLGHFITIREQDYQLLTENPRLVQQFLHETSLPLSSIHTINKSFSSNSELF